MANITFEKSGEVSEKTKQHRPFGSQWSKLRSWLRQSRALSWGLSLFIAGFIVAWDSGIHRDFFHFFVLLPFGISLTKQDLHFIFSSKIFRCLLFFLVYMLLSMAWSSTVSFSLIYDNFRYAFLIIAFVTVVAWIVAHRPDWKSQLVCFLVPVAVFAFLYSVFFYYGTHTFPGSRLSNMIFYINNPNAGSIGFFLVLLLGLNAVLENRFKVTWLLGCIGLVVGTAFLLFAQSRGLLLASAIGLAILLGCFRYWKILIGVSLIVVGGLITLEVSDLAMRSFIGRGDSYRFSIWAATLERIFTNPVFGEGILTDIRITTEQGKVFWSPHNIWLYVFMSGGLVGLGLFVWLIITTIVQTAQGVTKKCQNSCFYLSLIIAGLIALSFSCHNLIDNIGSHFWIPLWLPLGLIMGQELISS